MPLALMRLPRRRSTVSSMPSTTGPAGEGGNQEFQQQVGRRESVPGGAAEHAMVVDEPSLPVEPNDPQQAGHRALAGREYGTDQQPFGMAPRSLLQEHRCEG